MVAIVIIIPYAHILGTVWAQSSITNDNLYKSQGTMVQWSWYRKLVFPYSLHLLMALKASDLPVHSDVE
jgi:hypothetical protein